MRKALVAAVATLGIAAVSSSVALACSIPVFRYALQFWDPGPYELLVFHRGSLEPAAEAKIRKLEAIEPGVGANLIVRRVDLDSVTTGDGELDGENGLVALWKERAGSVVPSVVLCYPGRFRPGRPFASAPLEKFEPDKWLRSPARKTISDRLARGESAVWLFLESGDEKKDREAAERLDLHLTEAKTELRLPELLPEDQGLFGGGLDVGTELRLAFSVVRVSRKDPVEAPLVAMLLETEDDLKEYDEPMAFAVFGRGRALPALVGRGINRDMIIDQAAFLTGPCSCQVKEQNPGVDLLLDVDWRTLLMKARLKAEGESDGALARALADGPEAKTDGSPAALAEAAGPAATVTTSAEGTESAVLGTTLVSTVAGSTPPGEPSTATITAAAARPEGDDLANDDLGSGDLSGDDAERRDSRLRTILYAIGMLIVAFVFGAILFRGRGLHR